MKEDQDIFDLIEKYHLGLLSDEEKKLVEQRMQSDASFAESVKINGMVHEVVYGASLDMLRERMTKDLIVLDRKEKIRKQWRNGSAIVVGGLLALISWFYFAKNSPTFDKKILLQEKHKEHRQTDSVEKKTDSSVMIHTKDKKHKPSTLSVVNEKVQEDTQLFVEEHYPPVIIPQQDDSSSKVLQVKAEKVNEPDKINDPAKIDCRLFFHTISHPACKGENKGRIEIDRGSITGGNAPYIFYISNSGEKSSSGIFSDLKEGNYIVTVEDINRCRTSKEVMIAEKICASRKSYSFNPDYGEIWKIPFENGGHGNFTIYNRQGLIIFKGTFGGFDLSEWNGTKMDGSTADVALYVCILEYSNGKTEKMEVSVIR